MKRELLDCVVWAVRLVWSICPRLAAAQAALSLTLGLLPAALALAARGLIDTAVAGGVGDGQGREQLWAWLAVAFGLTIVDALVQLGQKWVKPTLAEELNLELTDRLLRHSAKLDLAFFEDTGKRDLMSRALRSPAARLTNMIQRAESSVTQMLRVVSLFAVLATIAPLVLIVIPPFALPFLIFQWRLARRRYSEEYSRAEQRRWSSYFARQLTNARGLIEVRLLDLAPLFIDRFRTVVEGFRDRNRVLRRSDLRTSSVATVLTTTAVFLLFAKVAWNTLMGTTSIGDLAVFGGAAVGLRSALDAATRSISAAMEQLLHIADLRAFLDFQPRIGSRGGAPAGRLEQGVEVRNLTFRYPGVSEPVLRDLSLEIRRGECVAVVGLNGVGKTTLVKLLARLYDPDEGRILFDGTDLKDLDVESLHRQLGVVLQFFGRYEASVADNIAYGDWRRLIGQQNEIATIAEGVGLREWIEEMPEGFETRLGRRFGTFDLSGGQWQKIATARAFARSAASLLILDEPTASLDARAEYEFFVRFKEWAGDRATLLISHRFSTVRVADRIIVLEGGEAVESGTHEQLLEKEGVYARLFSLHEQ